MIPAQQHRRAVRVWLYSLIVLVTCMVFIGGVTRLTESGLSIVEWKLLSGVFPPLTQDGWEKEFAAYRTSPEFQKKNFDFSVPEFKRIFWLEYIHRLLGRLVGIAFIAPFAYFLVRKALPAPLAKRMAIATLLVGMQGAVGWIMVQSGLIDAPRVNPLKLAMHLGLALALFSLLLWTLWQTEARARSIAVSFRLHMLLRATTWILVAQILLGALVAGNDAGLSYNTYPLMDGHIVPPSLGHAFTHGNPWYANTLIVQFAHRLGAHLLLVLIGMTLWLAYRHSSPAMQRGAWYLGGSFLLQFLLGVLTLIHAVPITLASAHQMAAMLLLAALLNLRYATLKTQAN